MTIVEFIIARLGEAEAAAQASGPARAAWLTYRDNEGRMLYTTVAAADEDDPWIADGHELSEPASARVIYDPAHVLRDIEAKRAIMKLYEEHGGLLWHAVAAIAAIDRDHPDFSLDWRQSC